MLKEEYILINDKKIYMMWEKSSIKYICDNKEYDKEEINTLFNVFSKPNNQFLYSELLNSIIANNDNINKSGNLITDVLEYIERLIPENARENFYNNLKTLKINLEFPTVQELRTPINMNNIVSPNYDMYNNQVNINKELIKLFYREAISNGYYVDQYITQELSEILMHELLHMSSTNIKEKSTGFINPNEARLFSENYGLTEGYTDYITQTSQNRYDRKYPMFDVFAHDISLLIGDSTMKSIYFSGEGPRRVQDELNKIINDDGVSFHLLGAIEEFFETIYNNGEIKKYPKNNILVNINHLLNEYLYAKINQLKEKGSPKEEIENLINNFKMVDEKYLINYGINPDLHMGVRFSIDEFNSIVENFRENKELN